ncbi:CG0192 family protein [Corynebacterium pseudodiphtheriticum]|uniref:Maltokinase N-terminal cap domain-containing protein n=1 Tax=Corynebacterium pseudodiphtheriticum TaxID=37637 RepID=A0AAP4F529_9CORY|nr:hypothetical protein [Corynebacterium pseudodiphtheriticum]MDK4286436.1 hypothetical protein [Corynebacterium pseudodiphtheriticum]MDK4288784.1 hypothetical protein [Corynebacterium pseudodiphtheriticum]MDK4307106.1 hypothetical protein [Corynebacterium pseudodiphtheriticum]MDK4315654.1 hypothetical protein [Corynebacterium pseudodiphtheriticum]MDK8478482.1 hypothetical protein [Corynebacterium pseudodiphtheriticum]
MTAVAEIFDAKLQPGKEEIAAQYGNITDLQGFYRLVDPAGEVGIEVYVGTDDSEQLRQLSLSYRAADNLDPRAAANPIVSMQHSVLGQRSVAYGLCDSVAVEQWVRAMMTGQRGAAFSNGIIPIFAIRGTGKSPDAHISAVHLDKGTVDFAEGTVNVDGEVKNFELHFRTELTPSEQDEKDTYGLLGVHRDNGEEYVLASLTVK